MLTLNDGRKEMYQWDIGRIATVDVECDVLHFSNLKYGGSLSVEVKNGEVAIPNKLLTSGEPIYCWAFVADENGNYTKQEQTLNVNKRAKPSDYVYTETETLTWKSLDERITELEKGGTGGSGDMQKSVYDPNNHAKDIFEYADDSAKLAVTNHELGGDAHSDIRNLITVLTDRLNALADSDDTTLDQLSEIVAYIKSNKSLIDNITTKYLKLSGGTMTGKIVFPAGDQNTGISNDGDVKIFGYGSGYLRFGDPSFPMQMRGSGANPLYGEKPVLLEGDVYSKEEVDAALGAYITDVAALVGGDA